jgi:dienelactone hydrolase
VLHTRQIRNSIISFLTTRPLSPFETFALRASPNNIQKHSDANGVNEYEQVRATMVAQDWGFAAFAADIYGPEYTMVENATLRTELLDLYRGDMDLFLGRIEAALSHVASLPEVDASNIVIMGYCFGGTGVINYALAGLSTAKAVVSFHGGLVYPENGTVAEAHMLVLSGGDDDSTSEIMDLEKRLDAANATWEITRYAGVEHAWTVYTDGT